MISGSNEQLQHELEYIPLKPDYLLKAAEFRKCNLTLKKNDMP